MDYVDVDATLEAVREAVSEEDWDQAVALVEALRPRDQADVFSDLPAPEQDELLPRLGLEDSADILEELIEEEAAEVAARLRTRDLARIVDEMEPDEAADLLGDIPQEQASEILAVIDDAEEVRPLLSHPDESAGGLMTSASVVLHGEMTVSEAIDHIRSYAPDSENVYYLFVVDRDVRLVGVVSLRQMLVSPPTAPILEIMDPEVIQVQATADRENAARLMARYDLLALPVVDETHHLLGLITYDDMVEVLEEEATEDIHRLGGVPQEEPSDLAVSAALRTRLPWLVLNLGTALASVAVLSFFEGTIASAAILTAFFPIVAGVSGSAGTQTLTVTVRRLALGEINARAGLPTVIRETLIGLGNGIAVGILVGGIALMWRRAPMLGAVVGIATLLNMISAAIAGTLVPLTAERLQLDPALAPPVLVTTITDALGYFIYLGLATLVLGLLT